MEARHSLTARLQTQLIKPLCEIFFLRESQHIDFKWDETCNYLGTTAIDPSTGRVSIRMNPRASQRIEEPLNHKGCMIGTLLHELCHMCIVSWGCRGLCGNDRCDGRVMRLFGARGHGKAWFLLASYVETAARKLLPRIDIRLGISSSVHWDFRQGGAIPGSPEYMRLRCSLSQKQYADLLSDQPGERWDALNREAAIREVRVMDQVSLAWLKRWCEKQGISTGDGEN